MPRVLVIPGRVMTAAERQARRRDQHRRMREALAAIAQARTIREARALASAALEQKETGR
jgi:hypothetical protein